MQYAVRFETLGCRLNQIEGEGAAKAFFDAGFVPCFNSESVPKSADVVLCIVNTCTVTSKAGQKARRIIRLLLKQYPAAALLVTGCYAELNAASLCAMDARITVLPGTRKSLLGSFPARLLQLVGGEKTAKTTKCVTEFLSLIINSGGELAESPFLLSTDTFFAHSRPLVKIQDGCNNECAYCAIRLARGRSASLDAASVVSRIQALEAKGMREVVLTGVNLCQYAGEYQGGYVGFTTLLELILEQTKNIALRISSLHPNYIDEQFCRIIQNDRIRPHFHLSVQSGSDTILAAMKRAYTAANTLDAVSRLRASKKNPFIACDIIAGFPGEGRGGFEDTLELCRKSNFAWIHAFPFSPRPGTAAFDMKGTVKPSVIRERVQTLQSLAVLNKIAYIKSFEGQVLPVITEGVCDKSHSLLPQTASGLPAVVHGVTDNFIHVEVPRSASMVRIVKTLEERIQSGDEVEALAEAVD